MKVFRIFLICIVGLLAHSTIMKLFSLGPFRPDLTLFVLIYVSLKEGSFVGIWTGFFIGLLQDAYIPSSLGVNVFAKSLIGYLAGFLNEKQWRIDMWARSIVLFVAFLVHDFISHVLRNGSIHGVCQNLLIRTLPSFVYTWLLWWIIWFILKRRGKAA